MTFADLIDRLGRRTPLMARMIARLGVGQQLAELPRAEEVLLQAQARCHDCAHSQKCAAWLALEAETTQAPPAFCSNGGLFTELAKQPARGG